MRSSTIRSAASTRLDGRRICVATGAAGQRGRRNDNFPKHRVPSRSRRTENRQDFTTPCCLAGLIHQSAIQGEISSRRAMGGSTAVDGEDDRAEQIVEGPASGEVNADATGGLACMRADFEELGTQSLNLGGVPRWRYVVTEEVDQIVGRPWRRRRNALVRKRWFRKPSVRSCSRCGVDETGCVPGGVSWRNRAAALEYSDSAVLIASAAVRHAVGRRSWREYRWRTEAKNSQS